LAADQATIADLAKFRPNYHPAGPDLALADAMTEVRAGRWMSMSRLLAETGQDWELRSFRSQVLAAVAVASNVIDVWLSEEPGNPHGQMMAARVAVARASRAISSRPTDAAPLVNEARRRCDAAEAMGHPGDPVPWICRLQLAHATGEYSEGPHDMPLRAPWLPLSRVWSRDPFNREAHHRMLACLSAGDAYAFGVWVASSGAVPPGSPLKLLPLYAIAESYPSVARTDPLAYRRWAELLRNDVDRGWAWFLHSDPRRRLVVDLSHLAHALAAADRTAEAAEVFGALGPYASRRPWSNVSGNVAPEEAFVQARTTCLAAHPPRSDRPPPAQPRFAVP
jgi:hypothetical protein